MHSKANGALMRITPLAVWGHQLSEEQLVQAARADAQLTHPNQACQVSMHRHISQVCICTSHSRPDFLRCNAQVGSLSLQLVAAVADLPLIWYTAAAAD